MYQTILQDKEFFLQNQLKENRIIIQIQVPQYIKKEREIQVHHYLVATTTMKGR